MGINLTKEVKDFYIEITKKSLKNIKEDKNKRKDMYSWIKRLKIVKMFILPIVMYRFCEITIKVSTVFFAEIEKNKILKFITEPQSTLNSENNLEKEQRWRPPTSWLQNMYKAIIIKAIRYWHQDRHINQRKRKGSLEINPCICDHMIFDKTANTREKGYALKQMVVGRLDIHIQRNEIKPFSYSVHKINSK